MALITRVIMEDPERGVAEGLCRCCLERGLFDKSDNLLDSIAVDGKNTPYADMLSSCYAVNISLSELILKEKLICDLCIVRLKDAYQFRVQVEEAQLVWEAKVKARKERIQIEDDFIIEETVSDDNWDENCTEDQNEEHQESLSQDIQIKKKKRKKRVDPKKPKKHNQYTKDKQIVKPTHNIKYSYKINLDIIEEWYGTKDVSENKWKQFLTTKIDLDNLRCLVCNETFCQRIPLNNHLNVHFPVYTCEHCGKPFATKERLDYHNRGHDIGEYKCKSCNEVFYNMMRFKRHLQKHFPYFRSSCSLCPERFKTPYKRLIHMVEVHNKPAKPFKCDHCDSAFLDPRKVQAHIRRVHLKERNFVCTKCGMGYHANYELKKHMIQSHCGEGLFNCEDCSESFTAQKALSDHSKVHGKDLIVMPIES